MSLDGKIATINGDVKWLDKIPNPDKSDYGYNEFISTSGLVNPLSNTRRMGKEMAEKVKKEGVDAVIVTST